MSERHAIIAHKFRERLASGPYVKPTERELGYANHLNVVDSMAVPEIVIDEKNVLYGGLLIGNWPDEDTQIFPWLLSPDPHLKHKRGERIGHTYVANNFSRSPVSEGFRPARCDSHLCTAGFNMIGMYIYPPAQGGGYHVAYVKGDYARRTTDQALGRLSAITREHPNFGIFLDRPNPMLVVHGVQRMCPKGLNNAPGV